MKKDPKSFKENIRNMVTLYSIVPVFIITFICIAISVYIWSHFTSDMVSKENNDKSVIFNNIIEEYSLTLNNLSQNDQLLSYNLDKEVQTDIYNQFYQLSKNTGFSSDFYLIDLDGNIVLSSTKNIPIYLSANEYNNWGIMYKMRHTPDDTVVHVNTVENTSLCIGKALVRHETIQGYIVAVLIPDTFNRFLSEYTSQSVITDSNGWIFVSNNYNFRDNLGRFDNSAFSTSGFMTYQQNWYYITNNTLSNKQLCIYSISDTHVRTRIAWIVIIGIIMIFVTILFITHLSIERIAEINSRDVAQIANTFLNVQEGNLDTYLNIDSSIEFKEIADSYNLMLDSLKNQIQHNKEMAEHVAFAQVKQLESQFNPHFIFNTLDNIRFMTKIDPKIADNMIIALSNLLRYSISNAGEMITVEEDLSYIKNYMTIVKMRFNRRLTYSIEYDDNIMDCLIPKLIVQPLLENSIKYGFADKDQLNICIKGYTKNDKLFFVCEDNGSGLDDDLLNELQNNLSKEKNKSSHLGLYNIHRRIQLLYRDCNEYGLRIHSKKGHGTVVTLILPINR